MTYYIKRTTEFFGAAPITVTVNDYSTRELAEKALRLFERVQPLSGVKRIKFFITTIY